MSSMIKIRMTQNDQVSYYHQGDQDDQYDKYDQDQDDKNYQDDKH